MQVMESLELAMRHDAPILAEYLGGAVNSDAHHMTDPRPDGSGVSTYMYKAEPRRRRCGSRGGDHQMFNHFQIHLVN
jgi:hypothetical protein